MKASVTALIMLVAVPLFAHPPKNVSLEYDNDTKVLSVMIEHSVKDPSKHYVKEVVVEVNGKKQVEQTFTRQADGEQHDVVYKIIDVDEGDKITVVAYCNISGKKKSELIISANHPGEKTE
jgi:desulfoferrodoxin (superoxide reductase-like protein)